MRRQCLLKGILVSLEAAKSFISVDMVCCSAVSHCSPDSMPLWSASSGLALAVVSTFHAILGVVSIPLVTGWVFCTRNPVSSPVYYIP